ncbi:glycosyltransferase family 25 protein [Sedimentitalea sp. JM2-8]|uniref:Glycosyltransferase family 25 protein n=1 Tax=Sedimentitalea xiamensis TaxID=3050037 RepID=A0ABT7FGF3_9RHOB|nr:glycosyltransferase family 25 protein [Sedimentitalea xiamensis]MDK3074215.1 glycosyltransferase family 25 protein [Sedimentitalea xiamensis]
MRSMIIHLPGSTKRRGNVYRLLTDLPDAEVVEAVDGRDPAQIAGVRRSDGTRFSPHYPFPLRPAEIGVFQSHRRCWQRILDEGHDFALVAEDDLRVDPDRLARALALIAAHATPEMFIRLPVKARETPARVLASDGQMRLILPRIIGLQCICQVVGSGAAERLLGATETIDRPVDTFLQMHWITGQPVHTILPNGNAEIANQIGGSTIQTKTRASGKLAREVKRALYRARLHLHPQHP